MLKTIFGEKRTFLWQNIQFFSNKYLNITFFIFF